MKKVVLILATLPAGLAIWAPARAITPTTATIDCAAQGAQGPFNFSGQVGESFTLVNTGASPCTLSQMAGVVTPSGAGYIAVGAAGPEIGASGTATFTIVAAGTFTVTTVAGTGTAHAVAITLAGGNGGPSGPAPVLKGSFDPNGGECVWDGLKKTFTDDFFAIGYMYAPGAAECSRPGYVFADWMIKGSSPSVSAGLPVLVHEPDKVRRHFVAQSGSYVAKWSPAVTFNMAGGTCTILGESRSGTYSVAVDSQGQTTPGTYLRVPASEDCSREGYEFAGWIRDGARANSGEILFASSIVTATWQPTIVITRSGRDGRSVSMVGSAPGLEEGSRLTVWVKFPGDSTYTRSSTTMRVGVDGSFSWSRETKRKVSVYFTNTDASVKSIVITIPGL